MTTAVLVHGAWHGAWCWETLTPLLEARGIPWRAVELPLTGQADDAAAVVSELGTVDGTKVLVGHSYGGLVISEAAEGRDDVAHLVYLAALQCDTSDDPRAILTGHGISPLTGAVRAGDDGTTTVDPAVARDAFYTCCDPADAERATARLRPDGSGGDATGAAWKDIPSTYVVCERDRAILPGAQRSMAAHATHVRTLDTDHSPFLSMPSETADIIQAAIEGR